MLLWIEFVGDKVETIMLLYDTIFGHLEILFLPDTG